MSAELDNIYAGRTGEVAAFEFNEAVAEVFADMIRRSVPGYSTTIGTIGLLAGRFSRPGTVCYDLGCSLGAASVAMAQGISQDRVRIIAVDSSAAMVRRCREAAALAEGRTPIEVRQADIRTFELEPSSMAVMNFTLQFLPPKDREVMLRRIGAAMVPGGVLVLSEKIRLEPTEVNELFIELHHQFKRANGYSDLEIAAKRNALEEVLIPESLEVHHQRILAAGFSSCTTWFQCLNFASLIAIK